MMRTSVPMLRGRQEAGIEKDSWSLPRPGGERMTALWVWTWGWGCGWGGMTPESCEVRRRAIWRLQRLLRSGKIADQPMSRSRSRDTIWPTSKDMLPQRSYARRALPSVRHALRAALVAAFARRPHLLVGRFTAGASSSRLSSSIMLAARAALSGLLPRSLQSSSICSWMEGWRRCCICDLDCIGIGGGGTLWPRLVCIAWG
mmetsp:Transcript_21408/g.63892  ORF Transcript_21408/g.63892 Transcript_21408/m.63892 type:complete len:202 (+) Transcript_21408:196-801(+)